MPAACVVPAHGVQALIGAIAAAFVDPGTAVGDPAADVRPLRAGVRGRGRDGHPRARPTACDFDLDAIAAAARATAARLVWLCDPNNPTGLLVGRDEWSRLPRRGCRTACVAVVDEAYMRLLRSRRARPTASGDVLDGRPVIVHPLVLEDLRPGRAAAGIRRRRPRRRAAPERRAGAVQREPGGARRRPRRRRARPGSCPGAGRRWPRRAQVLRGRARTGAGIEVIPSQANFVLIRLGVDDGPVCERLLRKGLLIRGGASRSACPATLA